MEDLITYGRMNHFEVSIGDKEVVISQDISDDDGMGGTTATLRVTAESVELLCLWLREAAELAMAPDPGTAALPQ